MPRQVVIEGLIAQVQLSDNLSFGLRWAFKSNIDIKGLFDRNIKLDGNTSINPGLAAGDSGGLAVPGTGFTFVGTDPTGNIRAVLTALATESRAKVLAAPHILVSDNREARIQVGSQVPLATSSTTEIPLSGTATTSTAVTSTIQYKDIGIILKVKPQINDSGLISLELSQEISALGDTILIANQKYQGINKTEATTNLVALDGQTIVIGAL